MVQKVRIDERKETTGEVKHCRRCAILSVPRYHSSLERATGALAPWLIKRD